MPRNVAEENQFLVSGYRTQGDVAICESMRTERQTKPKCEIFSGGGGKVETLLHTIRAPSSPCPTLYKKRDAGYATFGHAVVAHLMCARLTFG